MASEAFRSTEEPTKIIDAASRALPIVRQLSSRICLTMLQEQRECPNLQQKPMMLLNAF